MKVETNRGHVTPPPAVELLGARRVPTGGGFPPLPKKYPSLFSSV